VKLRLFVASVFILVAAFVLRPRAAYPPETSNAALRYWMAFAEMQDPPADKAIQDLLEKTVIGEAAWDEKKLGTILDANSAAIAMMQRASKLPDCDWGIEYSRGSRASIAYAPRARVLARLNTLQGIREMANGNSQAAVDTWRAGIRFSEHLANGGTLIFTLIAKSALLPNLRAITAQARQGHLNRSQLHQIYVPIDKMRQDGFNWSAAWSLEGLVGEQFLAELRSAKNLTATYEMLMGEPLPTGATAPSSEDVHNYREYIKTAQAALSLPPDTARTRMSALAIQKSALSEVVQRIIPNVQKESDARAEVFMARKELLKTLAPK
jgi:hypothetical protein